MMKNIICRDIRVHFYKSIEWSKDNGYKYYDIGTSDTDGKLIEGLFAFKKKFLAHGFLRKTYELNLN